MDNTQQHNGLITDPHIVEYLPYGDHEHIYKAQTWRTEPEIDAARQEELRAYLTIIPDIQQGHYPFNTLVCKLSRADIEWLLARQTRGLDLRGADLSKLDLRGLPLMDMRGSLNAYEWSIATPEQRDMVAVRLERADLRGANLAGALLRGAHLEGADLREAHLEGTDLYGAHLEGKGYALKPLPPADLRMAFFDSTTRLEHIILGDEKHGVVRVADLHWGNANLAFVDWSTVTILGDESDARQWKDLDSYRAAVRAYRQLATALQAQGLNEEANHFAYRAHVNRQVILRRQMILPLVLRLMQRPQMPLPLVFQRLEQWRRSNKQVQHNTLPFTLLCIGTLLLGLSLLAPFVLLLSLVLGAVASVVFSLLLRRQGRLHSTYQPAQQLLLPKGLLSAKQRQQQKMLLVLSFLLHKSPASASEPLAQRWRFPSLLLILLIIDNTLVCTGRYLLSFLLR